MRVGNEVEDNDDDDDDKSGDSSEESHSLTYYSFLIPSLLSGFCPSPPYEKPGLLAAYHFEKLV